MRIQSKTADQAAQVAATAPTTPTLIPTYGKSITKVRKAFMLPAASNLSKAQVMHTHHLLQEEHVANFGQMVATFRQLLQQAPCAMYKDAELRKGIIYLDALKSILAKAETDDYLEEAVMDGEHKTMYLSNVSRKVNYASLQAMSTLRDYRNCHHQPNFPKRHVLAGELFSIILNLYVPDMTDEQAYAMDALLELFITYDK